MKGGTHILTQLYNSQAMYLSYFYISQLKYPIQGVDQTIGGNENNMKSKYII